MINLADLMAGNTMAGEAGQQAPKILMGAGEIASGYLNRESAQNKLMLEDMKLKQAVQDQPVESLLKRAKSIQELNIGDVPVKDEHRTEALERMFPDYDKSKNQTMELDDLELNKLFSLSKEIAEESAGLSELNLANPMQYIQERSKYLKPEFKVDKEKYATKVVADAAKAEKKFGYDFQKFLAANKIRSAEFKATQEASDKRLATTIGAAIGKQQAGFAQQNKILAKKQAEDQRKTEKKLGDLTLDESLSIAQNPVINEPKKDILLAAQYDKLQVEGGGTPEQAAYMWKTYESFLRRAGKLPPGEGGGFNKVFGAKSRPKAPAKKTGPRSEGVKTKLYKGVTYELIGDTWTKVK